MSDIVFEYEEICTAFINVEVTFLEIFFSILKAFDLAMAWTKVLIWLHLLAAVIAWSVIVRVSLSNTVGGLCHLTDGEILNNGTFSDFPVTEHCLRFL